MKNAQAQQPATAGREVLRKGSAERSRGKERIAECGQGSTYSY